MRALLIGLLLAACRPADPPAPPGELRFVEGGVLAPPGAGGRPVGGGRELLLRPWTPGESVDAGGLRGRAPAGPECLPLFEVDLGDVSRVVALGGTPSTALAWAPDGERLAVGTHRGEVLVLEGWTGAVLARRTLAETLVKVVAWSDDGATLYAAEQSPDARLHALDPRDLRDRWTVRLADDLGSSPVPAATDPYGLFTLPAVHRVLPLPGGDVALTAVHSWPVDGAHRNRSRVLRLGPDGGVRAAWPPAGPADAVLRLAAADRSAGVLAVSVTRSAAGEPPAGLPLGGVQLLRLADLSEAGTVGYEALPPHFATTFVWEAFDVRGDPPQVFAGFGDGRVILARAGEQAVRDLGTPLLSGDVPLAASVSWGGFVVGGAAAVTGDTNIPWGSASPATRPPSAHPGANTLTLLDAAGDTRWSWHGEPSLAGLSRMGDDRVVVGAGARSSDERKDLWGALVFDVGAEPALVRTCPTDGPVFFQHAATDDGRVAVSVVPWKDADDAVRGAYRVVVLR